MGGHGKVGKPIGNVRQWGRACRRHPGPRRPSRPRRELNLRHNGRAEPATFDGERSCAMPARFQQLHSSHRAGVLCAITQFVGAATFILTNKTFLVLAVKLWGGFRSRLPANSRAGPASEPGFGGSGAITRMLFLSVCIWIYSVCRWEARRTPTF